MTTPTFRALAASLLCLAFASASATIAQGPRAELTPDQRKALIAKRESIESELESIAIIDRKVMVPMRDGKRMAADIYRPKDTSKKYPIIFSRTPYNFNFWDVKLGGYRDMTTELEAVDVGHHPVGDQNGCLALADDLPGCLAVRSDQDLVTHFLEYPPEKQGGRRLVLCDQDLHGAT